MTACASCGAPIIVAYGQNGTGSTVRLDAAPLDPPGYVVLTRPKATPVAVVTRVHRRHECAKKAAA